MLVASCNNGVDARPHVSRTGLLHRPLARGDRGALEPADRARRVPRGLALHGLPALAGDRPQRARAAARAPRRRGRAREARGRLLPHRQGPRARPRAPPAPQVGRSPLRPARGAAAAHAAPRVRRARRGRHGVRALRRARAPWRDRARPRPGPPHHRLTTPRKSSRWSTGPSTRLAAAQAITPEPITTSPAYRHAVWPGAAPSTGAARCSVTRPRPSSVTRQGTGAER